MLVRRGARVGRGMPRGWTALCLLSLLPSGFTEENSTAVATRSPAISVVHTNASTQETITTSTLGSTSVHPSSQDSNGTTAAISESTVNFTSTSAITSVPETMTSSIQSQSSLTITVSSTPFTFSTSVMTSKTSMSPGNVSDPLDNSTSPVTYSTKPSTSFSPIQTKIKGEIKCLTVKDVKLTQGICLLRNETSSCEDFKKDHEEALIRILCEKEQAENGTRVCSLLLAQSEVTPRCLLLFLANKTEIPSKLQLLEKHKSDLSRNPRSTSSRLSFLHLLFKMGIQNFTEQHIESHQHYSRKTLIALVTSGILLAVLGLICYFLMNRRSWSPTGERLELEP
uniref:CD34 molecule n=1 Tax=Equus caballus TaxID=9796 RepID=F6S1S0_HORSE